MTRETLFDVTLGLLAFAGLLCCGLWLGEAASAAFALTGAGPRLLADVAGVLAVAVLAKAPLPVRRTIAASIEVDAPPARVWDAIYPRQRYEYFSATVDAIEVIDAEARRFRYICAEPDPARERASFIVEVEQAAPERGFVSRVIEAEDGSDLADKHECVRYCFEPLEKERTRVLIEEDLRGLSLAGFLILFMGNPPRDYLLQLKAYCDGSPDRSYAAALMAREGERS